MNLISSTHRLRGYCDALTIVVFLGLLWLPTLDHFFGVDRAPQPTENRLMAKWPRFTGLDQSRDFIAGLENYFNDHFGFRKRLIRLSHHWRDQLFHDPASPEVLVGKDQWLFFSGMAMLENCTRQAVWTEDQLNNWRRLLESRRDWSRAHGIKYLFVVPPDKHTVYPEYLPAWMEISDRPTKTQQLVQYMKAHSTVEVLDLTQALIDAKKVRVDYLKTDTHWNLFGAFMGYRALIEALSRQMPGLEPLPVEAYTWKPVPGTTGDLVKLMGAGSYRETETVKPVPAETLCDPEITYDSARFPAHGPVGTQTCVTRNDKAAGRAIVFHDSFGRGWYSFLGQQFKEVVFVWQYEWDRARLEREKPDVVIDEIVERFFNQQDPLELMRKDRVSEIQTVLAAP